MLTGYIPATERFLRETLNDVFNPTSASKRAAHIRLRRGEDTRDRARSIIRKKLETG
jgi:hypothetical protein